MSAVLPLYLDKFFNCGGMRRNIESGQFSPGNPLSGHSLSFTVGVPIDPAVPSVVGIASTFVVSPALPDGLVFSEATGAITGTPLFVQDISPYVVYAINADGFAVTTIKIEILQ